jgi:hypothetical protein
MRQFIWCFYNHKLTSNVMYDYLWFGGLKSNAFFWSWGFPELPDMFRKQFQEERETSDGLALARRSGAKAARPTPGSAERWKLSQHPGAQKIASMGIAGIFLRLSTE